jgi:hypothetical protein
MKISIALLAAALAVAAAVAPGGSGAGGPQYSPGLAGYDGVLARGDGLRYTAVWTQNSTHVLAIRTEGGQPVRARSFPGYLGIPLVAYDGTAGGLSGNGKRLVVASYAPAPRTRGQTRFAVLDTKSFRVRRLAVLDGSWSFDAIAPDGSILYLTEHVRAGTNPLYRVRSYDVRSGLLRGAIVDRIEGEQDMGGEPVTRASSSDGRWAYTLYARAKHEPFIHALDTAKREAYCIGLPLSMGRNEQWNLRLRLLERSGQLSVRQGRSTLARVDTRSFDVEQEK